MAHTVVIQLLSHVITHFLVCQGEPVSRALLGARGGRRPRDRGSQGRTRTVTSTATRRDRGRPLRFVATSTLRPRAGDIQGPRALPGARGGWRPRDRGGQRRMRTFTSLATRRVWDRCCLCPSLRSVASSLLRRSSLRPRDGNSQGSRACTSRGLIREVTGRSVRVRGSQGLTQ